jgi:hypothetical protein
MCLKFGFVIFWQKDFGAKAAHKMLVKLTPGSIRNNEAAILIFTYLCLYWNFKKYFFTTITDKFHTFSNIWLNRAIQFSKNI